jgi:mannose-6-phosphate isomerase
MDLYPLRFEPITLPKIWGGRKLEALLSRPLPPGRVGESWELSDRAAAESVVANGPLKGQTLRQLLAERGPRLVGERLYRQGLERFPLLIKLIDAGDASSVQVHPDDDYAASHEGPEESGKTEMWLVLQADPGATIAAGLKPGTTAEAFKAALKQGALEPLLNRFEVREGDAVFIPAGRVHAMGRGVLVAEVQQNSDTTYRIHDQGRLEGGQPRALHVAQALETIRFDAGMQAMPSLQPQRAIQAEGFRHATLASCQHFHVERVWVESGFMPRDEQGGFQVLIATKAKSRLEWRPEGSLQLDPGDTVLIPAGCTALVKPEAGESQVLWAKMP